MKIVFQTFQIVYWYILILGGKRQGASTLFYFPCILERIESIIILYIDLAGLHEHVHLQNFLFNQESYLS